MKTKFISTLALAALGMTAVAACNKSEPEMIKVRNLGRKSLEEVKNKLHDLGLGLRKDD